MKKIVNIGLISLFLLISNSLTYGYDNNYWSQLPSNHYMNEEVTQVSPSDVTLNYFEIQNSSSLERGIARVNPNEDDNTIGGRIPIGDNLTLLILLSLTYLMCKQRKRICFTKSYRIFK